MSPPPVQSHRWVSLTTPARQTVRVTICVVHDKSCRTRPGPGPARPGTPWRERRRRWVPSRCGPSLRRFENIPFEYSNLAAFALIKVILNELFAAFDNKLHVCESVFTFVPGIKLVLHYCTLKRSIYSFM